MRILGIDLGSTSVKAVEIDSAFGRFEIQEYHERSLPEGGGTLEEQHQAIRSLVQSLHRQPDRIIVALKTQQVTFRNLQLPTKDKKTIQSSVQFELEDDLPFSLEDACYDFVVLSQSQKLSQIHTAASLQRHILSVLDLWNESDVDPDVITTEAWAYRALLSRVLSEEAQEKPVMLLQMGAQRTFLYVHWKGLPIVARELPWGGSHLTAAIGVRYGLPTPQAEAAKKDHGILLTTDKKQEATPEQLEFSATLEQGLGELIRAIRQAQLACKGTTHENVSAIYLSGGTALIPGLPSVIEEELGISTQLLHSLSAIASSGVSYSDHTDASFSLAAALALSQVGPGRSQLINFRKGSLVKQSKGKELNLAALKAPLLALSLILTVMTASLTVQTKLYRDKIKETNAQLERSVKSFFGQIAPTAVRTYLSNSDQLKKAVELEISRSKEIIRYSGPNPKSPLDFLKSLSTGTSKDLIVDLTYYQVGSEPQEPFSPDSTGKASLTFQVANPQIAEKLTESLKNKVNQLERTGMEEVLGPDGSKRWKITFNGTPSEQSYVR